MNQKIGWLFIVLLAVLAGCASLTTPTDSGDTANRPRVALVLGGGAARGFAHVG
jgi:hypothetical protein